MALRLVNRTRVPRAVSQLPSAMIAGSATVDRPRCSHGGANPSRACPAVSRGRDRASGGMSLRITPITLPTPTMTIACQNPNHLRISRWNGAGKAFGPAASVELAAQANI